MADQRNDFALGLWVITVFVLLFGVLLFIGGGGLLRDDLVYTVRYPATFPLPDEIESGAAVYCGASAVGQVTEVELRSVKDDKGKEALWAYLDFELARQVGLRKGCRIVARGPLLGGGGKLVITHPGAEGDVLPAGTVIDGAPAGSFEAALDVIHAELDPENQAGILAAIKAQLDPADVRSIIGKVHASLDDLNQITGQVVAQLDASQREALMAKLHEVLNNVNGATAVLREQMDAGSQATLLAKVHDALDLVNTGLADATGMLEENRPPVRDAVASLQRTADKVEHGIVEPIASELNLANVQGLLSQVHNSFEKINTSLDDIGVIGGKVRTTVMLNHARIDRLIANVMETSSHLKSASKDLRRNPWRLFYRPSLEETKQLNIFDAAREFSEASARLDDSSTRLEALLKTYDGDTVIDTAELAEVRKVLKQTFEDYVRAEEALWKQLNVR